MLHLRQRIGVHEVQQGAEDWRADILQRHHALGALPHAAIEQRMEDWRARCQDNAMRRQLLALNLH